MLQRLAINLGYSVFVALAWVGLWHLNGFLFYAAEVAPLVSLVFLPAILRPLAVLIFGVSGAIGLILGAAVTLPLISPPSLPSLLIILSNGLVPWPQLPLLLVSVASMGSWRRCDQTQPGADGQCNASSQRQLGLL